MSTAKEFGLSELSGTGSTAAELVSCKIGGCCGADTPPLSGECYVARSSPTLLCWLHVLSYSPADLPLKKNLALLLACSLFFWLRTADDLKARIGALPLWSLKEDNKVMSRTFTAKNWAAAMSFFNAVSEIAEEEGHGSGVTSEFYSLVSEALQAGPHQNAI